MLPLLPLAVVLLGGGAYYSTVKKESPIHGKITQERALVFETALNEVKDPKKLKTLAESFRKEGLNVQADLLEKRAKLRELPQKVKDERRAVFRKAMSSTNPNAVKQVASVYEKEGATGAANALRKYADSISKLPIAAK